jgi:outer membrane protein assembly factor BamD (BamD/ComL family)
MAGASAEGEFWRRSKPFMSIMGLSSLFFSPSTQQAQDPFQTRRQEFTQVGQDLQTGNLTAAQSDFAALQKLFGGGTDTTQSSGDISQTVQQLSTDLKNGNLQGAQSDYQTLLQQIGSHHHFHMHHAGAGQSPIQQALGQLQQALDAGSLTQAQSAYKVLQQDFQSMGWDNGQGSTAASASSGVSLQA